MRNRHRELLGQRAWQDCIENLVELAIVPNRPVAPTCEARPEIIADIAVVVKNCLGIVDLIGKGDEE